MAANAAVAGDALGKDDITHRKIRRCRIGFNHERGAACAQKSWSATVEKIRQRNIGRERAGTLSQLGDHRAKGGMHVIVGDIAIERRPSSRVLAGHHHMVTRRVVWIVVRHRANERKLVSHFRHMRQQIGDLHSGDCRGDWAKVAANLSWRIWLGIPHVLMGHPADDEDENAVHVLLSIDRRLRLLKSEDLR